ncbi:MAG TPA: EamA family transporter, partial [Candidatus Krumholzibacteria bacterium]|nr:EamA family transporter [Candidatus Krumholzibacteria bacterium]
MPPSRTRVVLAFAAVYLCWGSTYLAIRYAVETLPPFLMAGTRYIVAGLPMYLWLRRKGGPRPTFAHWRSAVILGAFMMFGGNGLVSWAEQTVPSSVAAVMIATLPLWMTLFDRFFFGGPSLHGGTIFGLLLGFGGVAWLMAPSGDELARVDPVGGGVLMLAAFLWSIGSLLSR